MNIASKNKPVFISTGTAEYSDIVEAVNSFRKNGKNNIVLLKYTSSYPAKIEDSNLIMIKDMAERFNVITGLSYHTLGYSAALCTVSIGAKVIEKHITLDKNDSGLDSKFSMFPDKFSVWLKWLEK